MVFVWRATNRQNEIPIFQNVQHKTNKQDETRKNK